MNHTEVRNPYAQQLAVSVRLMLEHCLSEIPRILELIDPICSANLQYFHRFLKLLK